MLCSFAMSCSCCIICSLRIYHQHTNRILNSREMRIDKNVLLAYNLHASCFMLHASCFMLHAHSIAGFHKYSSSFKQRFLNTSQRLLCILSLLPSLLCFDVYAASAAYYDSDRTGDSWEDAYIISSSEDLITLKNRVNGRNEPSGKYYVLNSDIDLTSETDWPE